MCIVYENVIVYCGSVKSIRHQQATRGNRVLSTLDGQMASAKNLTLRSVMNNIDLLGTG